MRLLILSFLGGWTIGAGFGAGPPVDGQVASARHMATGGNRAEALQMLDQRLVAEPGDSDAQTVRGIVLSWERRYDDARRDLESGTLAGGASAVQPADGSRDGDCAVLSGAEVLGSRPANRD